MLILMVLIYLIDLWSPSRFVCLPGKPIMLFTYILICLHQCTQPMLTLVCFVLLLNKVHDILRYRL